MTSCGRRKYYLNLPEYTYWVGGGRNGWKQGIYERIILTVRIPTLFFAYVTISKSHLYPKPHISIILNVRNYFPEKYLIIPCIFRIPPRSESLPSQNPSQVRIPLCVYLWTISDFTSIDRCIRDTTCWVPNAKYTGNITVDMLLYICTLFYFNV